MKSRAETTSSTRHDVPCIALEARHITETGLIGDTRQTQTEATSETEVERTTVEPADPECGSPGDGSSNGSVCCGGLGMTGRR